MNRFYQSIEIKNTEGIIKYQGIVFVGVSFIDQKSLTVQISKKSYKENEDPINELLSTSPSLVCGKETDTFSGWMPVGGPIKGFYIVKNGEDKYYDYISDFGVYVEDPCQAVDD